MVKYAAVAAVVALAAIGAFFALRNPAPTNVGNGLAGNNDTKPEINLPTKPWIEVIKPSIFIVKPDGKAGDTLQTGDEIENGTTIQADRKGLAAIHFPDGSILRIDAESKLTIEETIFEQDGEKLFVKIKHGGGRVWSKILSLVTPDSTWEVKTTNAVATVRGTAFGFAFIGGRSRILGSENTTKVDIVDPKTGAIVPGTNITLGIDKFIEIRDEDARKAAVNPKIIAARDAPAEVLQQEWVQRYKREDRDYNQKFDDLKRESGLDGATLRKLWRETIYKEFEADILKRRQEKEGGTETTKTPTATPAPRNTTNSPKTADEPKSLEIAAKGSLNQVTEGDQILFEAVLIYTDGTKKNITAEVSWQVIGPVGRIVKAGVFEAKLDESIAELGEASGTIIATWQDKKSGENFLGKTPIFKVSAKVVEVGPQEG